MADVEYSNENAQPILDHVAELRKLITYSVLSILVATILAFTLFLDPIMSIFTAPIDALGMELNYMSVSEAFTTQMKVAFLAGILIAFPFVLFFIWRFIGPALYPHEKKAVLLVLPAAIGLFVVGVLFAYLIVLDLALSFFLITMSADLNAVISVSEYIKFVYGFVLPFGIAFELPLAIFFLSKLGLVSTTKLKSVRKYVFFGIVVLSAVVTPPDVLSQILLSIPLYGLYELSIVVAGMVEKGKAKKAE